MPRPRVVVSAPLPDAARALLAGCDLVPVADPARFPDLVADADGVVALLSDRFDRELLERAPRLRVIGNFAVGVNNIDVAEATRRGVVVVNTPDVLTDATADLAFGLLIAGARRFAEGEALVRGGRWSGWEPAQLLGQPVAGATLGIVGFGRIGRALARRAGGFGMRVLYAAPRRAPADVERALSAEHAPLERLLAEADFVSLHVPLLEPSATGAGTRHLIGREQLARMKPTAVLVNTARGPVVDEAALVDALATGRIAGCGLDVYEEEPRVHPGLLASPRALLLPHLGSATAATRLRMAELAAGGVAAVLDGRRPPNVFNPEVYDGSGTSPPPHR
jgi:glyoxylate reductase